MGNVLSDEYWGAQIPRLINHGAHGRLTVRAIKLFTDGRFPFPFRADISHSVPSGALGSWGAALLAPYSDNPSTSGLMRSSKSALGKLVDQFYEDGFQVVSELLRLLPIAFYFTFHRISIASAIGRIMPFWIFLKISLWVPRIQPMSRRVGVHGLSMHRS